MFLVLQRHLNRLSRRGDGNIGSLQDLQHASPPPVLAPASVATLYRMPGSKAFRQRAPERSCLYDPQDPLHNPSMIAGWTACERLRRQEGEGDEAIPRGPAAYFILTQAPFSFGLFIALFHRPG